MIRGNIVYDNLEKTSCHFEEVEDGKYFVATDVIALDDKYIVGVDSLSDDAIKEVEIKEKISEFIDKQFVYSFVDTGDGLHKWHDAAWENTRLESGMYTFQEAKNYFIEYMYDMITSIREEEWGFIKHYPELLKLRQ